MENASIRPGYPKRHGTRRGGDTEHERMQRIAEYIKYMIIRPPTVKFIELGGGEELYRDSNKVTNGVCVPTCLGAMPICIWSLL